MDTSLKLKLCGGLVFMLLPWSNAWAYLNESFTGEVAPGWNFTAASGTDGASLTAGTGVDSAGQGWLRLTEDKGNQASFVYSDTLLPSGNGLVVEFDFVIWSGTSPNADGIVVALFDAEATAAPGGYGGSLGYAQRSNIEGLSGAVLGVGFDTFGNFSNPTEGRSGGPGSTPHAVAIRGPMGTDRNTGYTYLTGTDSLSPFSVGSAQTRPAEIYSARIILETDNKISVSWLRPGDTVYETLIDNYDLGSMELPDNMKIGFAAGTGGVTSYHELRNISVTARIPEPRMTALALGLVVLAWCWRKRQR